MYDDSIIILDFPFKRQEERDIINIAFIFEHPSIPSNTFITSLALTMLYFGLFFIWVNSPFNSTGRQRDQYIPDRSRVDTSLPAHYRPGTCAIYSAQTAYRESPQTWATTINWWWTMHTHWYLMTDMKRKSTQQILFPPQVGILQPLLFLPLEMKKTGRDGEYV